MTARTRGLPPFSSSPSFALTTPHTPSLLSAFPLTLSPTLSLPPFHSSLPFSPPLPLHFAMSQHFARACHCLCQSYDLHTRQAFFCMRPCPCQSVQSYDLLPCQYSASSPDRASMRVCHARSQTKKRSITPIILRCASTQLHAVILRSPAIPPQSCQNAPSPVNAPKNDFSA
jgi:hypothetical protein